MQVGLAASKAYTMAWLCKSCLLASMGLLNHNKCCCHHAAAPVPVSAEREEFLGVETFTKVQKRLEAGTLGGYVMDRPM